MKRKQWGNTGCHDILQLITLKYTFNYNPDNVFGQFMFSDCLLFYNS